MQVGMQCLHVTAMLLNNASFCMPNLVPILIHLKIRINTRLGKHYAYVLYDMHDADMYACLLAYNIKYALCNIILRNISRAVR